MANQLPTVDLDSTAARTRRKHSALVVGAGLAGLTAAIDLIDAGWEVTVVERRPFAGGRTFSFTSHDGDVLDNGQHVFLSCCTSYRELLAKLGCSQNVYLQRRLDLRILDSRDGPARLTEFPAPAPFHLLPSFLAFPYLSLREKIAAARALACMRLFDLPADQTFAEWLAAHGQSGNAIDRFWNLIVIPTCNAPAQRVSARQGGFVFREGLLKDRGGARIGYARVGLSRIAPEPAIAYLRERGAHLRFQTPILSVDYSDARVTRAISTSGETFDADMYIMAVPSHELRKLSLGRWIEPALGLTYAPIVGLTLWYEGPVFDGEVLALIVDGEAFWLFDRTRILGSSDSVHRVAVSISAADALMDLSREEILDGTLKKLARALPAAHANRLLRGTVTKVRDATFVPKPGSEKHRLGTHTPLGNLLLAGAWTNTEWPETMEGAIRSGHTAALEAKRLAAA